MFRSIIIAGLILLTGSDVVEGSTSTFDTNLEGWTLVDKYGSTAEGEIEWIAAGGNPGGFVEFTDEGNDGGFISAPNIYLGDWTSFENILTISYEHTIISEELVNKRLPYEIHIQGPGGEAEFLGEVPPPPSGWHRVEVLLESSEWTMISGDWSGLLANVTSFRIRIEQTDGHVDVSGIDNVDFDVSLSDAEDMSDNQSIFLINSSYPNPFSSEARIMYENKPGRNLTIEVYDIKGRLVARHKEDGTPEGSGSTIVLGLDNRGAKLATGHYFVRLTSGGVSTVCKMVLIR